MSDFHETRLPLNYDWKSNQGAGHFTRTFIRDSGLEERTARWQFGRRRYSLDYAVRTQSQTASLLNFYLVRQGNAYGFRLRDLKDHSTAADGTSPPTATDQLIYPVGDSLVTYQLSKTYGAGAHARVRAITKPVGGDIAIAVDGFPVSPSVDNANGLVVFSSAPSGIVTAGCLFDVPVRFDMPDGLVISEDDYRIGSVSLTLLELLRQDLHEDYIPPVFED